MAGRRSKISRLPPEIRELIGKLRTERGCTIDEIHAKLAELDVEVGRSSVGREVQKIDAMAADIEKSRAAAEAIMDRLGNKESRVARLNIELMHSLLWKLMSGEDGVPVRLDAREAMFVSTSLQKLSAAAKTDADREIKVRERVAKEMAQEFSEKLDKVEREIGAEDNKPDMAAALKRIREEVYGIFE